MPRLPEGVAVSHAIHPVFATRPYFLMALVGLAVFGEPRGAVLRPLIAQAADGLGGSGSTPDVGGGAKPSLFPWPLFGANASPGGSSATGNKSATQLPHPSVVRIIADEGQSQSQGSGSLVDVRDDCGLVVTNWHVVRDATGTIMVYFPDGFASPARVRKVDKDWDLAALIIWRPRQNPIPVSEFAPRPGEPLTIAGYGSGAYRAASGRCLQYVSPGMSFPPEMVEVSVEARQGDSGGPILNERGELAGVLFGAARGSTTGSYCGRVRSFLTDVVPRGGAAVAATAAAGLGQPPQASSTYAAPIPLPDPPGMTRAMANDSDTLAPVPGGAAVVRGQDDGAPRLSPRVAADTFPDGRSSLSEQRFGLPPDVGRNTSDWSSQPAFRASGGGLPPRSDSAAPAPWTAAPAARSAGPVRFEDLLALNGSPAEQTKTVLALIGLFTLVLQVWRFLGGEPAASPPAAPPAGK